jgi:hypothetical protein
MLKLVFFVPETHKEIVKQALFESGAGQYEGYDCCAWETLGQGQFRPLAGSQPFLGKMNQIETVDEYRVEMICSELVIKTALQALLKAHPYEVPAYEVWPIMTIDDI